MPTVSMPQRFRLAALACALGLTVGASAADEPPPEPFTAVYEIEWHGIPAGQSTLELKRVQPNMFVYSSRSQAHGLFRLAFPDPLSETSTFELLDNHVAPLEYTEDSPGRSSDDVLLRFDWNEHRVQGTAGPHTVSQPLEAGTQDPLSVQIELMRALRAGAAPASFLLFDKREATRYNYTREGTENLHTDLGDLATVIYRSDRPGSDRVTRLWLAPSLGYVPVQGERRRGDRIDFSLQIRRLDHPSQPASPPSSQPSS
jgi:hypothetical protein